MVDDVLPEIIVPPPNGTIFDHLDAHQIPWRNYYSTFPPCSYLYLGNAIRNHPSVVPIDLTDFLDLNRRSFAKPPALATPLAGPAQITCETDGPGQVPPPGSVTPGT